jgi:REP element-mobilizing transposase RayT
MVKKIRLYDQAYQSGHAFSITIATYLRRPYFARPKAFSVALQALRASAEKHEAKVFAYCFMPNHAHLLLAVTPPASVKKFMDHFKQLSGYRLKKILDLSESFWQPRYFDHGLREEESLESVASYIWQNPVRAGLVAAADDYPYSGSLVFRDPFPSGAEAPDLRLQEA